MNWPAAGLSSLGSLATPGSHDEAELAALRAAPRLLPSAPRRGLGAPDQGSRAPLMNISPAIEAGSQKGSRATGGRCPSPRT